MLTGGARFHGDDLSEVLATVLKTEPNWQALPADTPPSIRRLLRRCLEKDPRKRLSSIADARLELEEIEPVAAVSRPVHFDEPAGPSHRGSPGSSSPHRGHRADHAVSWKLEAGSWKLEAGAGSSPIRLSIALPDGDEITDTNHLPLAISPDGSRIAYVGLRDGSRQLFLRNLGDADPILLAGTEGARMPFFSPDGQWIGFFTNTQLKKLAVASGAVQNITTISAEPRGGVWAPDGTIYYAPHNVAPLWKVAGLWRHSG